MASDDQFRSSITESKLTTYFSARPNNFQFERWLGSGAGANAYLVRYRKQAGDRWDRIVVKTPLGIAETGYDEDPFGVGFGVEEFKEERKLLDTIRTRHLVRLIKFSSRDDPLRQNGADDFFKRWIYLEYLPHGTLTELARKCEAHEVAHLPNRLLWRVFMCLIRACVAMAYVPDVPVDRYDENEEPCPVDDRSIGYTHNDMHSDNIMIGDMLNGPDDIEHSISPVVKFIDLEVCSQYAGGEGKGVQRNLELVSSNMAELILFKSFFNIGYGEAPTGTDSNAVWFEPGGHRDGFATTAQPLLPDPDDMFTQMPAPWLDPDLRRLLCECAAVKETQRPSLRGDLLPEVLEAIETRDADYYRDKDYCDDADAEEDDAILNLLQRVLGAARPASPRPGPRPDEDEAGEGPESMDVDAPAAGPSRRRRDSDGRSASPESSGQRFRRYNFRPR
ncbi:kinase-like domain-containing protein [Apiospora marii]|uniref:kinase-like domain-containing protein n=1 Tax=Apiospora marii TaxID=335849 RepID=UPI003131D8E9